MRSIFLYVVRLPRVATNVSMSVWHAHIHGRRSSLWEMVEDMKGSGGREGKKEGEDEKATNAVKGIYGWKIMPLSVMLIRPLGYVEGGKVTELLAESECFSTGESWWNKWGGTTFSTCQMHEQGWHWLSHPTWGIEIKHQIQSLNGRSSHWTRGSVTDTELEGPDTKLEGPDTKLEGPDTELEGPDTELEGPDTELEGPDTELEPWSLS